MKRSDINAIMQEGNGFIHSFGYRMPPFRSRDDQPVVIGQGGEAIGGITER